MYTKHPEIYFVERMWARIASNEKDLKTVIEVLDTVFELGVERGKEEANFNNMMLSSGITIPKEK